MHQFASFLCIVSVLQGTSAIAQAQPLPQLQPQPLPQLQPQPQPTNQPPSAPVEQPQPTNQPPSAPVEQPQPTNQPAPVEQAQPTNQPPSTPVEQVVAAGLMTNFPDGQFYPARFISRAELASILVKAFQLDKRATAKQEQAIAVQDVPASYWAFNDIQTVLKTGVMQGYRGNMFFPNQMVTRAEAFAIFAQAYGVFQFPDDTVAEILAKYPDAESIPSWAKKAIATTLSEGFVNIDEKNQIQPLQPITRGDMAYALNQYLQRLQKPPYLSGHSGSQSPAKPQ